MHALFIVLEHALIYAGVWRLMHEYHVSPWLTLAVGAALMLLFSRIRRR